MEKGWSFQQKILEQFGIYMQKSEHPFITYIISEINSKWFIDLNVKSIITKLPEENIGKENLHVFELGKDILDTRKE